MDPRRTVSPESALASDIFDKFCAANTLKGILLQYRNLCQTLRLKPTHFPDFFPRLKAKLCSWRANGLWAKFEKRASHKCYNRGKACEGSRVLIIGAGPCGLRAAIEAQLLGAKVVLIEKRDRFSRNNVLHLWPFVITDLKALGAKKFYGKFCAGSIDHISIRQLQCMLLKVALLLGVEVLEGVGFERLLEPTDNEGWRARVSPVDHPVSNYNFDVLIGADGRRNTLDGFKRKALRAKLAIAITANFIYKHTEAEARVKEISGVSYIFNQKFFQDLNEATGIDLENIVYYKDETHYFVMTAKKQSLLSKGVLLEDHADTARLLSHDNISSEALMIYALEAAMFSTEAQLPDLEFAVNHYGQPDVAMFDFTAMYAAENACRAVQRNGHKLLMTLVGDSLLEPFWPTGSGCARGFLSSFDAAWMLRSWASGNRTALDVIAERESIYRLLGQTTPENLNKEHLGYTIDPHSRYPNLNLRVVMPFQVRSLFDSDDLSSTDVVEGMCLEPMGAVEKVVKKRRRDSVIAVDCLLAWMRDQVASYNLDVIDICDAFRTGDVLCAVIHRFRPDLLHFPLPSEENMNPLDIAACRNQIAFDLLQEEHDLSPIMTGFEAAQCSGEDYLNIIAYLSQIYEIFKGEIPQIQYSEQDTMEDMEDGDHRSSHNYAKLHRPTLVVKHHQAKPVHRRSRLSSGRDCKSDVETDSGRKPKKRKSDERTRVSVEDRELRLQEIEKNRLDRVRRRMHERMLQTERFIKSMRLLQLNDRSGDIAVENDVGQSFDDYTFHLYRQTAPQFDERCKMLEKKLFCPGRDVKSTSFCDPEKQNVPALAKHLQEKFRGSSKVEKKPKDLIRAIGKIEKTDWNVQLIEKKIAENKTHSVKKEGCDKVPKWSRQAFDDKREAMKRKIEGSVAVGDEVDKTERVSDFEENVKKLGTKLKDGNSLEVGQRGCNKVSQMATKLAHKLEKPKDGPSIPKSTVPRPVFEFPKKGGSETCHFCTERVYVVEKMTTEGKFFHRNCFRCEYCNTSLRLGNYVFDRDGRYGERFYCTPHYQLIKLYGWKKYDQDPMHSEKPNFSAGPSLTPNQQILSEMDDRGTTPERVEFENSVDFASEEELLSEMDEDEWTDRNFGPSNADDNNTSDEASDLSDEDDDITPDGTSVGPRIYEAHQDVDFGQVPHRRPEHDHDTSGSDTEVASDEEYDEEESDDDDEDLEDEEEEEEDEEEGEVDDEEEDECGGSTTEIETDSEFAEDPPHSVPGNIPTIVVDEPEQLVAKIFEAPPLSHTRSPAPTPKGQRKSSHHGKSDKHAKVYPSPPVFDDVIQKRIQEPVKKDIPERVLPQVNAVPKKWDPHLSRGEHPLASKFSLELKQKYLQGPTTAANAKQKTPMDPVAQNQFRSVLDMISEQQKLLQPAPKPSPAMQAFLEGAERLKQKQTISPLSSHSPIFDSVGTSTSLSTTPSGGSDTPTYALKDSNDQASLDKVKYDLNENGPLQLMNMNNMNIEKTTENGPSADVKSHFGHQRSKEAADESLEGGPLQVTNELIPSCMTTSDTPSFSQSDTTTTNSTVMANDPTERQLALHDLFEKDQHESDEDVESVTESADHLSELDMDDDLLDEKPGFIPHEPPRVEVEDEFGVTMAFHIDHSHDPADVSKQSCDPISSLKLEIQPLPSTNDVIEAINDPSCLALDFANLEFADVDAVSSPDDDVFKVPKKQGYCTLANEEFDSDYDAAPSKPPFSSSSTTTTGSQGSSSSRNNSDPEDITPTDRPIKPGNSSEPISNDQKYALVGRVTPFSNARDSLDYRKMKSVPSSPIKSKTLSSVYEAIKAADNSPSITHAETSSSLNTEPPENQMRKTSPSTVRKSRIEEINNERNKQSDLIRSMVLGRINKSPDKGHRNSRGSLSPMSASWSSTSGGSTEKVQRSENEIECGRSNDGSQNSILSSLPYGSRESSPVKEIGPPNEPPPPVPTTAPPDADKGFSEVSNESVFQPHSQLSNYEPVFTDSPRFRSRPKFNRPFSVYTFSVTNPPTPVNPTVSSISPLTPDTLSGDPTVGAKAKSPSVHRSMPDLSASGLSAFCTPNFKQWEQYKITTVIEREKAREAARARARLKSDQELGIDDNTELVMYKDKLKRKFSVPEDDVFDPTAPVVVTTAQRLHDGEAEIGSVKASVSDTAGVLQSGPADISPHPVGSLSPQNSEFVQLQLRLSNHDPERRISPEKAKAVGWDAANEKFPNYFTPTSPYTTTSFSQEGYDVRPRSYTFSEQKASAETSRVSTDVKSYFYDTTSPQHATGYSVPRELFGSPDDLYGTKSNKSKAISSEMLLDDATLSVFEPSRGISVPDVSVGLGSAEKKQKKSKDRERRRSIIQTFSDFFGGKSLTNLANNSTISPEQEKSSESSPTKEKFSLFKLTPKLLSKDRRLSKSKDLLMSKSSPESASPGGKFRAGLSSYLSQPDIVIQRLSASPTPFKCSRQSLSSKYDSSDSASLASYQHDKTSQLSSPSASTMWKPPGSVMSPDVAGNHDVMQMIGQITSIEKELRILEIRGVAIEKKLKGEMKDERNRSESELMEEWFTLIREKTRLARLEKKLRVELEEAKLENQQTIVREKLEHSLNLSDIQKTPEQKTYEMNLLHELNTIEQQKGNLLAQFHQDMQQLDADDAALEEKITASCMSPRESNV